MSITPQQAARELQIRRAARQSVLSFAEAVDVPGRPVEDDDETQPVALIETKLAVHHKLILSAMDRCSKRDTGRLMIFCPPGSAKSTYASVVFPADYLGRNPDKRLILASYGAELATKMGRRTRGIIQQNRYRGIHGATISQGSSAAHNFTLTNGSEYMAAGILSGITGNRGNGIVIDDPIKGRDEAESETLRNKTWAAYQDDILTRLVPGGWLVLIQTRWHEDDLAGRILPTDWNGESGMILCKDGNEWEVLCLQAECANDSDPLGRARGDMLWPEWFTEKHWSQHRSDVRKWGSLFQQLPKPLDGNMFKPDKIGTLDALPAGRITWIRGWDLAATEGGGDYTAGLKLGRHEDGRFIIADLKHGQWGVDKRDDYIRKAAEEDGRTVKQDMPQDPGAAGKAQIIAMGKMLVGFTMLFGPESGNKEVRAEPAATQVNIGNVYMLRADWNGRLRSELRAFPSGTFDDIVDALSRAFARLLTVRGPNKISDDALAAV